MRNKDVGEKMMININAERLLKILHIHESMEEGKNFKKMNVRGKEKKDVEKEKKGRI